MFGLYQGSTPTSERCRKLGTSTLAFETWIQGSCNSDVLIFFNSTVLDVLSQCEAGNVMIAKTHPDFPSDICLLLSTLNAKPESQQLQHFSSELPSVFSEEYLLAPKKIESCDPSNIEFSLFISWAICFAHDYFEAFVRL